MLDFPKIAPNTEKSLIPKEYWIGQEASAKEARGCQDVSWMLGDAGGNPAPFGRTTDEGRVMGIGARKSRCDGGHDFLVRACICVPF